MPFSAGFDAGLRTFGVSGGDDPVAREAAADLAQAFRGSLAPVRRIILESRSSKECEQRLRLFYADWKPDRIAPLVEQALSAYATNGIMAVVDRMKKGK